MTNRQIIAMMIAAISIALAACSFGGLVPSTAPENQGNLPSTIPATSINLTPLVTTNPPALLSPTTEAATSISKSTAGRGVTINAVFPPLQAGDRNYAEFGTYILKSSLVDGINPALVWSAIDHGPGAVGGQYQFATFDNEIQRFIDAGKTVNLIVYANGYSPSQAPPAYVMNDPTLHKVSCNTPVFANWPVVYEPAFKNAYKAFIAQVIQHYTGNAHIGYIRFGLSRGGEIYPFCAQQEATLSNLSLDQWGTQVWLPYDKEMLDYEKSLNPSMQIMGPTTQFGTPDLADAEAMNAANDGFGFGSQGLQKQDIAKFPNCTSDWCNLFSQYAGQVPLELQTYGPSDPTGSCGTAGGSPCQGSTIQQATQKATGPLPPLLTFAAAHHTTIFEIYTTDLLLALDPNYAGYATAGASYMNALAAVHGK